ncbi:hypothetical protein LTS17_012758 [Exophiala oligosperma]
MDSIIFEDPSKPRIRSKEHARAAPASFATSSGRECIQEVEPQAVTPASKVRLHERSHTSDEGRPQPRSLLDQNSEALLYNLCRTPRHDANTNDGWIWEDTSLHDDFSLAQIDENGLVESLDDDLESLFSGIPPDLEFFKINGSEEHSDGQTQSYSSRVARTYDVIISSPSDDNLVRSETPGLQTNSDAVDLTVESNCPRPKRTAAPSPQQYFPPSSGHKSQIEVVIPTRHPSSASQRNLLSSQSADVMVTPERTRRWTVSPRPNKRVERGRKRRYRSEADFDSSDSCRVRAETDSKETPSLFHSTLMEGSAAHSCRNETQLQKLGLKYGAPIEDETYNSIHGSDSEQTLIDRGASLNFEDEPRTNIFRGKLGITLASSSNTDEPVNCHHEQDQHRHRLKRLSVQPVTSSDAAFITAIIDRATDLQDFLQAPAAWAHACGVQPDSLANVTLKPLANCCWLFTATVSRCASGTDLPRRGQTRSRERWSLDLDMSSDFCPSEAESNQRPTKRGRWTVDEDNNLTEWRRLGKSWSWIFDRFPERSEAAVRSRWFVVLAPLIKVTKTRPV